MSSNAGQERSLITHLSKWLEIGTEKSPGASGVHAPARHVEAPSNRDEIEKKLWQLFGAEQRRNLFDLNDEDIDRIFGRLLYISPFKNKVAKQESNAAAESKSKALLCTIKGACIARDKIDSESEPGGIKSVGKFILEPELLEGLKRLIAEDCERTKRISKQQANILIRLQDYLISQGQIQATLVLSHDGSVISRRGALRERIDSIASWALCSYLAMRQSCEILGVKSLYHAILEGREGTVIISDFGQGILLSFSSKVPAHELNELMQKLESLLG